jgi:hypothetical protein
MTTRTLILTAAAVTALLALTGCDGGGATATPSGAPSAAPPAAGREKLVDAAKCMRAHGFPDYPDPVETGGRWAFPPSAANMAPKPAPDCTELFRLAGALPEATRGAVANQDMAALRKWAGCIRTHGLPDWPDPGDDGVFHPGRAPAEDDPAWQKADAACRSLEPGPISVDAGTTGGKAATPK